MFEAITNEIPPAAATPQQLAQRRYPVDKMSHIRADTSMGTFGHRPYGFLYDPGAMYGHALPAGSPIHERRDGGRVSFHFHAEDAQTASVAGHAAHLYDHLRPPAVQDVPEALDQLVRDQNARKLGAPADANAAEPAAAAAAPRPVIPRENYNEIVMRTPPRAAYLGMFHKLDDQAFDREFPEPRRRAMAAQWHAQTGQDQLHFYRYQHQANSTPDNPIGPDIPLQSALTHTHTVPAVPPAAVAARAADEAD